MELIGPIEWWLLGPTEEVLIVLMFRLALAAGIFFLLTLDKALSCCSPESRTMQPGYVWLLLIPLFNIAWQFMVVAHITASLDNEFRKRNIIMDEYPSGDLGLWACIFTLLGTIAVIIAFHSAIVAFLWWKPCLIACGLWIFYWMEISRYSAALATPPAE